MPPRSHGRRSYHKVHHAAGRLVSGSLVAAAALGAGACKTPPPPGVCPMVSVDGLAHDWQIRRARLVAANLDSLRGVIAQSNSDEARIHLVQEYLLAAEQLRGAAKDSALRAVSRALTPQRNRP